MDAIWQVFGVNSKNQLTSKHKPITMRDILLQPIAFHASSAFHVVQNVLQRALIGFPQYLLNVWNTAVLNYNNEFRCHYNALCGQQLRFQSNWSKQALFFLSNTMKSRKQLFSYHVSRRKDLFKTNCINQLYNHTGQQCQESSNVRHLVNANA